MSKNSQKQQYTQLMEWLALRVKSSKKQQKSNNNNNEDRRSGW
jgi:hypothetical protein